MLTRYPEPQRPQRSLTGRRTAYDPSLPRGLVLRRTLVGDARNSYLLYLPRARSAGSNQPLVTVHGISRNAKEQVQGFMADAERHGRILIAPIFDAFRFRDYQRLGRAGRGPRADLALQRILREVSRLTGADCSRPDLFGYSGGGQFVHRYAFAHPRRVRRAVLGAPGWYTLPDPKQPFPYGTADCEDLPDICFDPAAYLGVPFCILVGELDLDRDRELKKSRRLDRKQGRQRVARGRHWTNAMRDMARRHGLETRYQFELLAGADHAFSACITGGLSRRVFEFLTAGSPGH